MKDAKLTPPARLWHLAEELVEALEVLNRSAFPMLWHDLATLHHAVCSCGRFGFRADLTGEGERMNNAGLLLAAYPRVLEGIAVARSLLDPGQDWQTLMELADVAACMEACRRDLEEEQARC